MKKGNISIFVPHLGCPCQCSFCNQKTITGQANQPTPQDVDKAVKTALKSKGFDYEIAFFGGSFTAIDREYMISLLKAANKYIKSNEVKGIRISTRPDCIDEEILDLLKEYGVTSIELGAQSMDDEVLLANRRGHTAKDVENASEHPRVLCPLPVFLFRHPFLCWKRYICSYKIYFLQKWKNKNCSHFP